MLIVQVSHRINPIYDTVVYDSAHKELRITIFFLGYEKTFLISLPATAQ